MSRLDELPPDQRAALSLLLLQRKSYAEVAAMLHISDRAVHDRAQAALAVLAPAKAREVPPDQRALIGDYLLGQLGVADRLHARTLLTGSAPARTWALTIASDLAPLAPSGLPDVPGPAATGPAPAAPGGLQGGPPLSAPATTPPPGAAPPAGSAPGAPPQGGPTTASQLVRGEGTGAASPAPRPQSSRVGGALVLVAILAAVIVAVVLITNGGSSSHNHANAGSTGASTATGTTTPTGPRITARLPLRSPIPASRSIGLLQILAEGSRRAFYVVAEHMPATNGFFYALWLYNNPASHEPLGKAPPVGASHRLEGGGALPANANEFHEVLLTRETSTRATHPGSVVLRGAFSLGA
ncbi:MAG TPA: sigma-70 region 4 domain-containing protein [Solirubrobacteraceae bacterium]|nr:sigma-70 region 4 domain-containing protein [Solirubrobacteraceae bacterium]